MIKSILLIVVFSFIVIYPDTLSFDTFSDGNDSGWIKPENGPWSVVNYEYACARGAYPSSTAHYIAYTGDTLPRNYSVEADVKVIEDTPGGWGAICFRIKDSSSFFSFLFEPKSGNVHLDKIKNYVATNLASATYATSKNVWYKLKIIVWNDSLYGFINNYPILSCRDTAFGNGRAGLIAYYTHCGFDNFLVQKIDTLKWDNYPPEFTTVLAAQDTVGRQNVPYHIDLNASDPNPDVLVYSLSVKPSGMAIDTSTGLITWTPADTGRDSVQALVSDGHGAFDTLAFAIRVNVNPPPVFSNVLVARDTIRHQNAPYTLDLNATDPNSDVITYSLSVSPSGMTINASTGLISWTPADTGRDSVQAIASDGYGGYDTISFSIRVTPNFPPVLTTLLAPQDTVTRVGTSFTLDLNATDSNSDVIIYSLPVKPSSMTINSSTGLITWIPLAANVYTVKAVASDGYGGYDTLDFSIRVVPNNAPVFSTVPATSDTFVPKNIPYSFDLDATDADLDAIVYSLPIKPYTMSINSSTGLISWNPLASGRNQVRAVVSDNHTGYDTLNFFINVFINQPPQIINLLRPSDTAVFVNVPFTLDIDASDPEGTAINYVLAIKPASMSIDSSTGLVSWTPPDTGHSQVRAVAADIYGARDTLDFWIGTYPQRPLLFTGLTPSGDTSITETDTLIFSASVKRLDTLAALDCRWTIGGIQKSITPQCTLITSLTSAGICSVGLTVTSGTDTLKKAWQVDVLNKALPPVVLSPQDNAAITIDSLLVWELRDPDIDTATVRYRIEFLSRVAPDSLLKSVDSIRASGVRIRDIVQLPDNSLIYWRILAWDALGHSTGFSSIDRFMLQNILGIESRDGLALPEKYELMQNQPNPFNPSTVIRFGVPEEVRGNGSGTLCIFSLQGVLVKKHDFYQLSPGYYGVRWDALDRKGKPCPNGLYVYKLKIGNFSQTLRMMLIK